jgi:YVTN family beta-propeller protein
MKSEKDPGDFIGTAACGSCHNGPDHGHQYDVWRRSAHARAWAVLSTPRAAEIAAQMNLSGDPQQSAQCLKCHAPSPRAEEGVGCEACHGAGKNYAADAIMRDPAAARAAGLKRGEPGNCGGCHEAAHGKPFRAAEAWKQIAHAGKAPPRPAEVKYKNPLRLAFRPGTEELWVSLETGDAVAVIDTRLRRVVAEIPTGAAPTGIAFTADGKRAFVSNREEDTVAVVDAAARRVEKKLTVGDEPHGVLVTPGDTHLLVLNTSSEDIHVFHPRTLAFEKKLAAGRGPWDLALSPDGARVFVTNMYSNMTGFRQPLASELTVIDAATARVEERRLVEGTNLMMGISWHPSGRFALATMNRTKHLVPMTRLLQGWTITNGIAVLWADGRIDQVLLDQPGLGFADATDVKITPNGRFALVTSSGTNRIGVIGVEKMLRVMETATEEERRRVLPNHLGKAAEFLVKSIPTADSPRGLAIEPGGRRAYVANCLDDSIGVIDLATLEPAGKIPLGGPREITKQRWGEKLFHNARITFRRQFSCHSCHPDGHVDGITYDIEADGIGVSPVDNRTLRGIGDTAPFKWEGTNPSLQRQCGARLAVFFTRGLPFTPDELSAVDYYISTIRRPPNRYYTPGTRYTPAQRRGKEIFERTMTNDGRVIPPEGRCVFCHPPPYYTSRRKFDVGTRQALDRTGLFDVPHLNNIYDSAPYLHNGMAKTLEEIWTVYNPYDKHGYTNDMTKDQLNDLIEFLKTL